jgi:hypothetical protein
MLGKLAKRVLRTAATQLTVLCRPAVASRARRLSATCTVGNCNEMIGAINALRTTGHNLLIVRRGI